MSKTSDWLPGPRTEIIEMCRTWNEYLTTARRTAWGIPVDTAASMPPKAPA